VTLLGKPSPANFCRDTTARPPPVPAEPPSPLRTPLSNARSLDLENCAPHVALALLAASAAQGPALALPFPRPSPHPPTRSSQPGPESRGSPRPAIPCNADPARTGYPSAYSR